MKREAGKFVFPVFAFLILTAFASVSAAKTIYVPDDYAKIQWAVDNASDGDTIIVRDGTYYYENVNVNKQLTLKSENGSANCIIDAGGSGSVFTLNADHITIHGFTIKNGGNFGRDSGIEILSNNNTIYSNVIINNKGFGVFLYNSNNNTISNNTISNNLYGVEFWNADKNTIVNCEVSDSNSGILVYGGSNYNVIIKNIILNNTPAICPWCFVK